MTGEEMMGEGLHREELILVDEPAEFVRRITLNRPRKRNAISTPLRAALLDALHGNDCDPGVRVSIVRGAGACFSAGYDLSRRPPRRSALPVGAR